MEITQPIFIRTEKTIKEFKNTSSFNNYTDNGFVLLTCFTNTEIFRFHDNNSVLTSSLESYIIKESTNENPFNYGTHLFEDPLKNTTAFAEDNSTYQDYYQMNIKRYEVTTSSIYEFTSTFPQNNLKGSSLNAAITAFHIQELGRFKFTIIVRKEETELLQFCCLQNWDYILLT